MAGSTFKTIGNIGAASGAALAVGARDTVDGADDVRRKVRVERDRRDLGRRPISNSTH